MKSKKWIARNIWIWSLISSLILWTIISIMSGKFSLNMLVVNATLSSFLILLSLGQMTIITSGNGAIDLSIQYTVALAAYISSIFMAKYGIVVGIIMTLFICGLVGILNGIINMYLKVPAMITTLAVGYIVYSAVLIISTRTTGMPLKEVAYFVQKYKIMGISPLIFITAIVTFGMYILVKKTKYGKRLHAVGQNSRAADLAGIHVVRVIVISFIVSSVLAGLTGILLGGYFGGAFQNMGVSYLLTSIAATVIGGTSVAGGKSSIIGVVTGALLLSFIVTFLNLTRLPMAYQNLIQGTLLIVILIASVPKEKKIKKINNNEMGV